MARLNDEEEYHKNSIIKDWDISLGLCHTIKSLSKMTYKEVYYKLLNDEKYIRRLQDLLHDIEPKDIVDFYSNSRDKLTLARKCLDSLYSINLDKPIAARTMDKFKKLELFLLDKGLI